MLFHTSRGQTAPLVFFFGREQFDSITNMEVLPNFFCFFFLTSVTSRPTVHPQPLAKNHISPITNPSLQTHYPTLSPLRILSPLLGCCFKCVPDALARGPRIGKRVASRREWQDVENILPSKASQIFRLE